MGRTQRKPGWSEYLQDTAKRNREIARRYKAGETQAALAREYKITRQRVCSIVAREGRR